MKKHITAFYVETLLLIVVFVGIILLLTWVFGAARQESQQARLLTNSVCLAENAAEAFSAAGSPEELQRLLDESGNTSVSGSTVTARYTSDMEPDKDGQLLVEITWVPEASGGAGLVSGEIRVLRPAQGQELYTLRTAVYLQEVTP